MKRIKKMKKISLVVAILMVVNIFTPISLRAFAAETTNQPKGNGTKESPYEITTFENLLWISDNPSEWGKSFVQKNDIDASATAKLNNGVGWRPIGNDTNKFTGSYDGGNFSITGLSLNRRGGTFGGFGFFGVAENGLIKNLTLKNVKITGYDNVGGLVGKIEGSSSYVENCSVEKGTVEAIGNVKRVGGLIGHIGKGATIKTCFADVEVKGGQAGGFVGGIFGNSKIENSYAKGSVLANKEINYLIGGFVGWNSKSTIMNCYSTSQVATGSANGFLGKITEGKLSNNFWNKETSGQENSVGEVNDELDGITTSRMQDYKTFNKIWDFETVWGKNDSDNDGYPFLKWQGYNSAQYNCLVIFVSEGKEYIKNSVESLEKLIKPENPTKDGSQFKGWFKDYEYTIPWDFEKDIVTSDLILYAKWESEKPITKTIDIYPLMDTTMSSNQSTMEYGATSYLKLGVVPNNRSIKFSVYSMFRVDNLPEDAEIQETKLQLTKLSKTNQPFDIYLAQDSKGWTIEGKGKWDRNSAGNIATQGELCWYNKDDIMPLEEIALLNKASFTKLNDREIKEFNLPKDRIENKIKDMNGVFTLAITPNDGYVSQGGDDYYNIASKEYGLIEYAPTVKITYTTKIIQNKEYVAPREGKGYYVATDGSDENSGSINAPFRTIGKAASVVKYGDTVYIRGGKYDENVNINKSGKKGYPITFKAYDNEKVIISGTEKLENLTWEKVQGKQNLYVAELDEKYKGVNFKNQLFANKKMQIEARWPNATFETLFDLKNWATMKYGSRDGSFYDRDLRDLGNIDLTGAKVVMNTTHQYQTWIKPVTALDYDNSRLNFVKTGNYGADNSTNRSMWSGGLYYITGALSLLDAPGEWYKDIKDNKLYVYGESIEELAGKEFEYKKEKKIFEAANMDYIVIEGIAGFGGGFEFIDCNNITIDDCHFFYPTGMNDKAKFIGGFGNSFINSSMAYTGKSGIFLQTEGAFTLENNFIHDIGWNGGGEGSGVRQGEYWKTFKNSIGEDLKMANIYHSDRSIITKNTIVNSGYSGLFYNRSNSQITYNNVVNSMLRAKDSSGINIASEMASGNEIAYNWVHDNVTQFPSLGIRNDNWDIAHDVSMHHNVVWNIGGDGLEVKGSSRPGEKNYVYNNTLFNMAQALQLNTVIGSNKSSETFNNLTFSTEASLINGNEYNNIFSEPDITMVEPYNLDFRPKSDAAIDKGYNKFTGDRDINGVVLKDTIINPKDGVTDIGAYESNDEYWIPGCTKTVYDRHLEYANIFNITEDNLFTNTNTNRETIVFPDSRDVNGLPILHFKNGEDDIIHKKYDDVYQMALIPKNLVRGDTVILQIGDPKPFVSGIRRYIDRDNLEVMPYREGENGAIYVPLKFVVENLGFTYRLSNNDITIISRTGKIAKVKLGSDLAMNVNGESVTITPPIIKNGYVFVDVEQLVKLIDKFVTITDRGIIWVSGDQQYDLNKPEVKETIQLLNTIFKNMPEELSKIFISKPNYSSEVGLEIGQGVDPYSFKLLETNITNSKVISNITITNGGYGDIYNVYIKTPDYPVSLESPVGSNAYIKFSVYDEINKKYYKYKATFTKTAENNLAKDHIVKGSWEISFEGNEEGISTMEQESIIKGRPQVSNKLGVFVADDINRDTIVVTKQPENGVEIKVDKVDRSGNFKTNAVFIADKNLLEEDDKIGSKAMFEFTAENSKYEILKYRATFTRRNSPYVSKAIDPIGEWQIECISNDKISPVTSHSIDGDLSDKWYTSDVIIELFAEDELSGVKNTEYRINDSEWSDYKDKIIIKDDGKYNIECRSVDNNENFEEVKMLEIIVDKTAPTYELTFKKEGEATQQQISENMDFVNSDRISLNLQCEDSISGVKDILLTVDGKEYSDNSTLDFMGYPGNHNIYLEISDNAGNKVVKEYEFRVIVNVESMMRLVDYLEENNALTNDMSSQLRNSLKQAEHFLNKNNKEMALKHLGNFKKHLNNKAKASKIDKSILIALNNSIDYMIEK